MESFIIFRRIKVERKTLTFHHAALSVFRDINEDSINLILNSTFIPSGISRPFCLTLLQAAPEHTDDGGMLVRHAQLKKPQHGKLCHKSCGGQATADQVPRLDVISWPGLDCLCCLIPREERNSQCNEFGTFRFRRNARSTEGVGSNIQTGKEAAALDQDRRIAPSAVGCCPEPATFIRGLRLDAGQAPEQRRSLYPIVRHRFQSFS